MNPGLTRGIDCTEQASKHVYMQRADKESDPEKGESREKVW